MGRPVAKNTRELIAEILKLTQRHHTLVSMQALERASVHLQLPQQGKQPGELVGEQSNNKRTPPTPPYSFSDQVGGLFGQVSGVLMGGQVWVT